MAVPQLGLLSKAARAKAGPQQAAIGAPSFAWQLVLRYSRAAGLHEPSRPAAPRIELMFKNRELPIFDVPALVQATQKNTQQRGPETKNQN